jgi:hypothetical protein
MFDITKFPIDAGDDVVTGDHIQFMEGVFVGYGNAHCVGTRMIQARVIKESYGELTQQHTFTLEVIAATGTEPPAPGVTIRRKGRNDVRRKEWADENRRQEVAGEKHARGDAARAERNARRLGY